MNVVTTIAGVQVCIKVERELWINSLLGLQNNKKSAKISVQGDEIIQNTNPPLPLHQIKKGLTKKRYGMFVLAAHIENAVAKNNILFLHASSFIHDNKAYLYLGPSGVGKTTLINKHQRSHRLSNDTALIKKEGDVFFVYKSIFDRSEIEFDPLEKVPLAHIFMLKQADTNAINKLSLEKKLRSLMRNDYFHMNEKRVRSSQKQITNKSALLKTIISVVKNVPISELLFTPSLDIKKFLS